MRLRNSFILAFLILVSCDVASSRNPEMEVLPYFDLKGFIDQKLAELPDSVQMAKSSRINWEEALTSKKMSREDIKKELEVFYEADINSPSFAQSYDTEVVKRYLIHRLKPEEKGRLQEMIITYTDDKVSGIQIKMKKDNTFYTSTTIAEIYFSGVSQKIDHYNVETTQKILLMDPNNIRYSGSIKQ